MTSRLLLCWLFAGLATAVEATLELPDPLPVGQTVHATLTVSEPPGAVKSLDPPVTPGLRWGQATSRGQQVTIINGVSSRTSTLAVEVTADQAGTFQIEPLTVTFANGEQARTKALQVQAQAGDASLSGEIQVDLAFEPAKALPGERVSMIYRLRFRDGLRIDSCGVAPPAEAEVVQAMNQSTGKTYGADGTPWQVITLRWGLVFTTPGTYAAKGQQPYQVPLRSGDFFTRMVTRQVPVKPAAVLVEPLPTAGRPADYAGLIGPIAATATLARDRIASGEGVTFAVTIRGKLLDLQRPPVLAMPAGLVAYPKPETTADDQRTFTWDLVPERSGTYTLPVVRFPYFDIAARSYQYAETPALTLTVVPGRRQDPQVIGTTQPASNQKSNQVAVLAPLRGQGAQPPSETVLLAAAGGALACGLLAGALVRLRPSVPRGPHRGRSLVAAIAGSDHAAIASAIAAFTGADLTPEQQAAVERIRSAADAARFGGQPVMIDPADADLLKDIA